VVDLENHLTADEKLERLAVISASIARRLYEVRNWTTVDKRQHKEDMAERDALLGAAFPRYLECITRSRVAAEVWKQEPRRWRVRLAVRLLRLVLGPWTWRYKEFE
jgi:hypothetical protein